MKIKLKDYSLISKEWIDEQIEELKKEKQKYLSDWFYTSQLEAKMDSLESVKQQLIPSEKLAKTCFENGTWMQNGNIDREQYFSSEIEII